MNQHDFESRVLQLWMTTRVPLTRANVLYYTKAPRKKVERWLDEMVRENVLDVDSDDEGEMIWVVRGSARPARGPERIEDVVKLNELSTEVRGQGGALARLDSLRELSSLSRGAQGEKSVIASGLLSLFFGPFGWLYAAPMKEAVPAALVTAAVLWLVPHFLLIPFYALMPLMMIASGAVGVLYAWQHNRAGHPVPLLPDSDDERPPRRR